MWCGVELKLSVGMLAAGRASAKFDDLTGALLALKFRLSPLPPPSSFASEKCRMDRHSSTSLIRLSCKLAVETKDCECICVFVV